MQLASLMSPERGESRKQEETIMRISGRGQSTWAPERTRRIKERRVESETKMFVFVRPEMNFGNERNLSLYFVIYFYIRHSYQFHLKHFISIAQSSLNISKPIEIITKG